MNELTVAEAVVRVFNREEVPFVAGVPGGGLMEILDSMYKDPKSRFILVRHEQSASFMAHGYARVQGKPAVCMASRGGGAANMAIGIWGSFVESTPMVAITGQVGTKFLDRGAFEEADVNEFMRPITKWSRQVPTADRVPEYLEEAFRVCQTGRPGPAHLAIPFDFPAQKIREEFVEGICYTKPSNEVYPSPKLVEAAASLLLDSLKPVMIVGGGVISARASQEALDLAEFLTMPVVTTWQRKPMDERHDLVMGNMGVAGTSPSATVLREADVVLAVGCRFSEMSTEQYQLKFGPKTKVIHIDIDPNVIGKVVPVSIGIVAHAKIALRQLTDLIKARLAELGLKRKNEERLAELKRLKRSWIEELQSRNFDAEPIIIARVVTDLRDFLGEGDAVVLDSGNFIHDSSWYFTSYNPWNYIYPTGGLMGFGLPGAMGVKLALPNSRVVCLAGDGGFSMTVQELETALRENIPVVCVVLNNMCLGNIKVRQKLKFNSRFIGCDFTPPQNFALIAQGFGAYGERVTKPADIKPALDRAFSSGRVAVIDVVIDPNDISQAQAGRCWWKV
ncbi:MAG: thiamine pyrophosphate-binding protein [Bacillota bacterium]